MKDKKNSDITERQLKKRREYMKKYYAKKKAERIKSGEFISVCRGKIKKDPVNKYFTIRRGEFIVNFN
tara:strand:+ start:18057 stop:18260 length:204 start_codon:yes stop_codon:yes gene_type:complete